MDGWIKLHRKIDEWEWRTKPETFNLFITLLLRVNHKDGKWRGIHVPAGSILTGRKELSRITGLSERQIRTALNHLKSTNEVTIQSTNEYSIISITNWENYQSSDQQSAIDRPASDQQATTNKNDNNKKNEKEDKNIAPPDGVSPSVWDDFKKLRRAKKAPITKTVIDGIEKQADLAGWTLQEALAECCIRNWQSFKAEWVTNQPKEKENAKQRLARETRELLDGIREGGNY